jgi:carbon-monoxide dehydrogenase large subunit
MGFIAILCTPFAHAKITSIDVDVRDVNAARRIPGVRLVVIGKDILKHTIPIPQTLDSRGFGGNGTEVYWLTIDEVKYVGEPVAAVVANDKYIDAEVLDLIQVEYDDLLSRPATRYLTVRPSSQSLLRTKDRLTPIEVSVKNALRLSWNR